MSNKFKLFYIFSYLILLVACGWLIHLNRIADNCIVVLDGMPIRNDAQAYELYAYPTSTHEIIQ